MLVKVGTYTGDGADARGITGVGFQPDVVWIKGGANETVIRTSSMAGDLSKQMATAAALAANLVQSLDAGGFTVGDDARVNANGTVYYYLALRDDGAGDLKVSTYTGNGSDNRDITGIGFQPQVVFVFPANTALTAWNMVNIDFSMRTDTGAANLIQVFGADGFQVGSSTSINANTIVYHYIAIKDAASVAKIGTYTGNGSDNRDITGVGFDPDFVFTQKDTLTHRVAAARFKDNTGDDSALITASAFTTDLIQGFVTDGFQVGTSVNVNTNTAAYHYLAFAETASGAAEAAAGVVAGVSTVSGTLTATVRVAGVVAGVSTASGTVRATVRVAGLAAGASTAVGAIKVAAGIAGAAAGTSTVSGTLSSTVPVSASSAGVSTASGTVLATTPISGATAGTSTVGGAASAAVPISGASAGVSTLSGTLAGQGQELASGVVVGQSAVSGTLTSTVPVQAVSAGVSTVSASLTVEGQEGADEAVAGVIAATSTVAGTLSVQIQVAASAAGTSGLAAALSSFAVLAGSSAGVSTVSANLSGGEELLPAIRTASSDSAYGTVVSSDVALTGVTADRVLMGATASDSEG